MDNASNALRNIAKTKWTKKILEVLKNKRLIVVILILLIIVISLICAFLPKLKGKKIMTVADTTFYTEDYMIYLKLAKDDYFGKEIDEIPQATLNTLVNQETNLTVEEYLKQKTQENLKIAGIIEKIAKENNISLSEDNYKEIEADKETLINNLGGKEQFKEWLETNRTTEEAYDRMSQTEKLYSVIYDTLFAKDMKKDLTDKEKENVQASYKADYKKIKQIIILTVDVQTLTELNEKEKQQKKLLAETILEKLKKQDNYNNFDEFIVKYSDDVTEEQEEYGVYYKSGQLLEEIEEAADELKVGEISGVVESEYAYHIILREELDDGYLESLYEKARENKLLTTISDTINDTAIIIEDTLEKIEIK